MSPPDTKEKVPATGSNTTDSNVTKATILVIEKGVTLKEARFEEGEVMRELVRRRLLRTAGIGVVEETEPQVKIETPVNSVLKIEKPDEEFCISGSYGPDSPEVKTIINAHKADNPVSIYEFMQGMVDYGSGKSPPPRILIEHESGKKYLYAGENGILSNQNDPIIAIEFLNGGEGMSPEDIIINRHGGDDHTLGQFGKGLTLAIAYLVSKGMNVKSRSHFGGRQWAGNAFLESTISGVAKVLVLKGRWNDPNGDNVTSFRVERPTDEIIKAVAKAWDIFLYANPKFPGAVLVEPDHSAQRKVERPITISSGKVMCLEGVISGRKDGSYKHIYIDGLRIPLKYNEQAILPWSIQELGNASDHCLRAKRSHDSMSYDAFEISTPVLLAVQQSENENLLRRLIQCAMKNQNIEYLEFRDTHRGNVKLPMSQKTAALVTKIWEAEYGKDTVITSSVDRADWYKKFGKSGKKVIIVPSGLYLFLKRANIPTVEEEERIQSVITFDGLNKLHVPSANSKDRLEKLMDYIAQIDGEVQILQKGEGKCMVITIPRMVKTLEEFNGQTEHSDGIVMRTVAVIAYSGNTHCEMFAVEQQYVHEIHLSVAQLGTTDAFSTKVEIKVTPRDRKTEYDEFEEGMSYIFLSGKEIEAFTEEGSNRYIERRKKEKEERRKKMPSRKTDKVFPDNAPEKRTDSKTTIGQIKFRHEESNSNERKSDPESKYPCGYYKNNFGSVFSHDSSTQEGFWQTEYRWLKIDDVPNETPYHFASADVMKDFNSMEHRLLVPVGHKIIALKRSSNAPITLYREDRTGIYMISGSASRLVYYTWPDEKADYDMKPPIDGETENLLVESVYEHLDPGWVEFIKRISCNQALINFSKVALAQEEWNRRFKYDKDFGKNDQIHGSCREVIAAKVLNTLCGICNISATGFALLLRSLGIPSRVCTGYWKQTDDFGGKHMWIEYWNGDRWIAHETQVGIKSVVEAGGGSVQEVLECFNMRLKGLYYIIHSGREGLHEAINTAPLLSTRKGFRERLAPALKALQEDKE